jgi:hypothetical protein
MIVERFEKTSGQYSVHNTMIGGYGHMSCRANMQAAVDDGWTKLDCTDSENSDLRRVDDGGKAIYLFDHTQIANRECAPAEFVQFEFIDARTLNEITGAFRQTG